MCGNTADTPITSANGGNGSEIASFSHSARTVHSAPPYAQPSGADTHNTIRAHLERLRRNSTQCNAMLVWPHCLTVNDGCILRQGQGSVLRVLPLGEKGRFSVGGGPTAVDA